jgi:hypothetical protein
MCCVYINHLFTTCNTCESQCKYCSFRSLCACYLSLFIATYIDCLESTHVQVGQAGVGRGTALRDWCIHGEQAGMDTRQWIRYINHSKTNTCRHLYRVKANICLGFVFMLTIVTVFFGCMF